MKTQTTYIFKYTKNGKEFTGMGCGFLPDFAEKVIEERQILIPAEGKQLKKKETGERFSSVWLKDGDKRDNYSEVVLKEELEEPEAN